MKTTTARCSSLPRLLQCPASQVRPATSITTTNIMAAMGTSVHEHLKAYADGKWLEPNELAEKNHLDPDDWEEHAKLCAMGRRRWDSIKGWFPNPNGEEDFAGEWVFEDLGITLRLTGHIDLWTTIGTDGRLLDWKTGYVDSDFTDQMRGYAAILFQKFPELTKVQPFVVRVRDSTFDVSTYSREEINDWLRASAIRLTQVDEFSPSLNVCRYCPRGHECKAKTALVRSALQIVHNADDGMETLPLAAEKRGPLLLGILQACSLLQTEIDKVKSLIKADVALYGGVLPAGEMQLQLTTQKRQGIDFAAGEEVLREQLGSDLARCVTVRKAEWEKVIKERAGRGQKSKAVMAGWEELKNASAITETIIEKLEVRKRQPKEIEDHVDSNATPPAIAGAITADAAIAAGF